MELAQLVGPAVESVLDRMVAQAPRRVDLYESPQYVCIIRRLVECGMRPSGVLDYEAVAYPNTFITGQWFTPSVPVVEASVAAGLEAQIKGVVSPEGQSFFYGTLVREHIRYPWRSDAALRRSGTAVQRAGCECLQWVVFRGSRLRG